MHLQVVGLEGQFFELFNKPELQVIPNLYIINKE